MTDQAEHCLSCGQVLGLGRFCVNCGRPKPEHAAAPRPPVPPVPPPPVHEAPPPARYPLFADEAGATSGAASAPVAAAHPTYPTYPASVAPLVGTSPSRRRSRASGRGVAAIVAVVVLLGAGGFALLGGDDPAPTGEDRAVPGSSSATAEPLQPGGEGEGAGEGEVSDLTRLVEASPPATAAASRDVKGNAVRYEAFNMLDGQPDTAWRMPGDASGKEIVFRLDGPTRITQVGLINGYAKVEPGYDGYAANRRILTAEWVFDDGTVVPQSFTDDLALQAIAVDGVTTTTITLRIVSVTAPGSGPSGRDYTAISDVSLAGLQA